MIFALWAIQIPSKSTQAQLAQHKLPGAARGRLAAFAVPPVRPLPVGLVLQLVR